MGAVLVVDDISEILDALSEALSEFGWDVVVAISGDEAKSVAFSRKIDVVLCDVLLNEGTDGRALRDEFIRRGFGHIPFAFMTASTRDVESLKGDVVLRKPFSVSEVLEILTAALSNQRLAEQGAEKAGPGDR